VAVLGVVESPPEPRAVAILLHGLEGSDASGYLVSLAHTLVAEGFRVTRLNMRTCGGTEAHARTLYHAGLTSDLAAVIRSHTAESSLPLFLAGFSLGGNVVLKLAGETGSAAAPIRAVAAVSTPLDLDACCRQMMRPENRLYEQRFVSRLKDRYHRRHSHYPHLFPLDGLNRVRGVYDFDDQFTAPHFGFGTAANYYATQSSIAFLPRIATPTLLIQAEDDPLIPFEIYRDDRLRRNPCLQLAATPHGGHVGFLARRGYRFWADLAIRDFFLRHL
jgi:predicted alpha/beta-fold hydrolase